MLDLSDDHLNSDVVKRPGRDFLVARLWYGKSGIFHTDLNKALNFFEATKVLQNTIFLQPR